MAIKIEIIPNGLGYTAEPVSQKLCEKYGDYMFKQTGYCDASVFFQEDYELPESVQNNRRAMRDLRAGWIATVLIDPWEYGYWLGYDACDI